MLNPYIAGAPVVESSMFFGREEVFAWIERSLAGKYVDHILVIHGQRRVGKTSVLKQIPNFLPDRYIQVFFDLQGRTTTTLDRFLWWLAREIARALKQDRAITIPAPERDQFAADPEFLIHGFLPTVQAQLGDQVLLLTFDEFDTLDRDEIQESFSKPLITYLNQLMGLDWLNFVFSIGSSGDKLENMQASYTDFFKSALYRKISFLTREDSLKLITKPVEGVIRYDRKAVDRIHEITSGHPYFTQLMCHELFSLCQKTGAREVSKDDVESILEDVVERGTVNLKFVWDEADDLEKWILAGLAQLDGTSTPAKLNKILQDHRVRFSESDLNSAIIHLRDKDVVTQENQFIIHLMHMWLTANRPLDRVREELVEVNPIANRYIEIGDEYRDRGENEQAIESYRQALNANPKNLKAQSSIATVHLKMKAYAEAVAAFEQALEIDSEDVVSRTGFCEANLALGDRARAENEGDKAIEHFKRILVINPAHADARDRLADIYSTRAEDLLSSGHDEQALSVFNQALEFAPENEKLIARYEGVRSEKKAKLVGEWLAKAERARSRERWEDAADAVEQALKLDPEDAELRAKLVEVKDAPRQSKLQAYESEARQAIQRGNFEKAIAAIETAVQLAPEKAELAQWLGSMRSDQLNAQLNFFRDQAENAASAGEWDKAIQAIEDAIKIAPEKATWQEKRVEYEAARHQAQLEALRSEAERAHAAEEWDAAIDALERYLKLAPGDEAVEAQLKSLRVDKRQSQLKGFKSQAEAAAESERWDVAVTAWGAYLALEPDDRAEVEGALQKARIFATLSADYAEAGQAIRKKRYGRAIGLLQGIIAHDPTYKSASRLLVEAVEANKTDPVWRRGWLLPVIGAAAFIVLGIVYGPKLMATSSTPPSQTAPVIAEVGPTEVIEPTQTLSPTPTPTDAPSITVESLGELIKDNPPTFEDDFSTVKSEWTLSSKVMIDSGYLKMQVPGFEPAFLEGAHLSASDFIVQFDYMFEGDESTSMVFNIRNFDNGIDIHGSSFVLDQDQANSELYRSGDWNQLVLFAHGDHFVVYLNDRLLTASTTTGMLGDDNAVTLTAVGGQGAVRIDNWRFWNLDGIDLEVRTTYDSLGLEPGFYEPILAYIESNAPTFEDDFSAPDMVWGSTSEHLAIYALVEDGVLTITDHASGLEQERDVDEGVPGLIFPTNGLFDGADFVLQFDLNNEFDGSAGIQFHTTPSQDAYYEMILSNEDTWVFRQEPADEPISSGTYRRLPGYSTFQFIVRGQNVAVFLRGSLIFETDGLTTAYTSNRITVEGPQGSHAKFDNFKFWNLDGVEFNE